MRLREGLPACTRSAISFSVEVTDLSFSVLMEFASARVSFYNSLYPRAGRKNQRCRMDANGAAGLGELGERTDGNTQLPRVLPLHREKKHLEKGEGGAQPSSLHRSSAAL